MYHKPNQAVFGDLFASSSSMTLVFAASPLGRQH